MLLKQAVKPSYILSSSDQPWPVDCFCWNGSSASVCPYQNLTCPTSMMTGHLKMVLLNALSQHVHCSSSYYTLHGTFAMILFQKHASTSRAALLVSRCKSIINSLFTGSCIFRMQSRRPVRMSCQTFTTSSWSGPRMMQRAMTCSSLMLPQR